MKSNIVWNNDQRYQRLGWRGLVALTFAFVATVLGHPVAESCLTDRLCEAVARAVGAPIPGGITSPGASCSDDDQIISGTSMFDVNGDQIICCRSSDDDQIIWGKSTLTNPDPC